MSNRILRDRLGEANNRVDRSDTMVAEADSCLVQTIAEETYPTTAGVFFACQPLLIDGPENEGGAASFTPDPVRVIYAYNLGSQVPPLSTRVILSSVGGRWVFRFDG